MLPYSATKRITVFKTARRGCPCGEGGDGREKPTSELHISVDGEVIEEIREVLEWGGERLGGNHEVMACGFDGRGFDTHDCFLLWRPSSRLSGCCRFWLGFLGPAVFLVAVTLGCVGCSVTV